MKRTILTTLAALGLGLGASGATIITQWNFNDSDGLGSTGTLVPSIGTGTASTAGGLPTSYNAGTGSSDPLGSDANNSAWRMNAGFPTQGTSNKTCGAQLNISTVGYENITLMWDQANANACSKYWRVQYSIDNGLTWVDKDVFVNNMGAGNAFTNGNIVSFATIPGANNNPNFGVRIVSEWQSTAVGGSPIYVPMSGTTYSETGAFRLDMVTFSGDPATGQVQIFTNPTNQVVAVGQPAAFYVAAGGGTTTITYQWRKNGTVIPEATEASYALAAAQLADAGSYDVIVANAVNSVTSTPPAILTVRTPSSLAWTGESNNYWDTSSPNWVNTNTLVHGAYANGDHVLFDSQGAANPSVSLTEAFTPNSVTVDADFDYTLAGGPIGGASGLTKRGSGTLILDNNNTYTGPTVIESGVVQLGLAAAHGALGTGPVTNNGALVFKRSDNITVQNSIHGSGAITNLGSSVTFTGPNVFNGPIVSLTNTIVLSGNQVVNSSDLYAVGSSPNGYKFPSTLALAEGAVIGAGTTIHLCGSLAAPDMRCYIQTTTGTNTINGPILVEGSGNNGITADNSSELRLNGTLSAAPGFAGYSVTLRGVGVGSGILNGTINLPGGVVHKADSGTWAINSTGNSWAVTSLAGGTLRVGAHDALPTNLVLYIAAAKLELAGFNQQLGALLDGGGAELITNISATANSILTVGSGTFSGTIADSAAGGKISLTVNGTDFTLAGFNTYHGDTTVSAGTLHLSGAGDIPNSAVINLAGGGLDASARYDGTMPVYAGQTLKGNGTLAVNGSLENHGTVELKVNKTGGIVSNDKLTVTGVLSCGGTLKLDLTGEALSCLDVLEVFAAGYYGDSLPVIEPAVPAFGATWDTSTLLSDGRLRIQGPPVFTSTVLSGSPLNPTLTLNGGGGITVAYGTFSVVTSANVAAPMATWTPVQTGSFDGAGNFSVTLPITPGQPQQFYRLKTP